MAIALWDLAGADEARRFSPYCWRTKMALWHKGLAFETIPAPGPWIARAACAGEPTDLFFPVDDNATDVARSIDVRSVAAASVVASVGADTRRIGRRIAL